VNPTKTQNPRSIAPVTLPAMETEAREPRCNTTLIRGSGQGWRLEELDWWTPGAEA
jgi:hypothetical protein